MLPYFPTIYPGELLYSVLARYKRHVGVLGMMHTLDALFGNRKVIASFDLPGHLKELVDNIPFEYGITTDFIIDSLTLYPYFTAFEPFALQVLVRKAMRKGEIDGLHVRLGLAAFRIGRVNRFRFCTDCCRKMLEQYEELYWRRDHQLSSVLVCPEHGLPLLESTVSLIQCSRHDFVAPSRYNCPFDAKSVLANSDPAILPHLQRLASSSSKLLDQLPVSSSFDDWTTFYRRKMLEVGLVRSARTMNQQQLDKAFMAFYGGTLEALPNVIADGKFAGDWLMGMVRKHRKAHHPLYHLLLQDFLEQQEKHFSPFGQGPWSCRNPLADHYNQLTIKSVPQHHNHGKTVGVFSCSCGYVYTRCLDYSVGILKSPRYMQYGPLLEPALSNLIDTGVSLREIARRLHLDPKSVISLATKFGLAIPWKNQQSVLRHTISERRKKLQVLSTVQPSEPVDQKNIPRKRYNWLELDNKWVATLEEIAPLILAEIPPVRLTVSEFERHIGRRCYFGRRRNRLPRTTQFLALTIENIEKFQYRRIQWAISELTIEIGELKAWQVMRKAGVRSTSLSIVNSLIDSVTNLHVKKQSN